MQCQSGDGLSSDGRGLCQRDYTKIVEFTFKKKGETIKVDKRLCDNCAAHWSLVSPTTVKVLA